MPGRTPIFSLPTIYPDDPVVDYPSIQNDLASRVDRGIGLAKLWDSVEAGVVLPAVSVSTPTLPQTARHLLLVWSAHGDVVATIANLGVRVNGQVGAAYYSQAIAGSGAVAPTSAQDWAVAWGMRLGSLTGGSAGANLVGSGFAIFPGYSTAGEAARMRMIGVAGAFFGSAAGATSQVQTVHGFYAAGGPITSLTFLSATGGNLVAPSRFTVYGVA